MDIYHTKKAKYEKGFMREKKRGKEIIDFSF